MRIAHVIDSMEVGGAERLTVDLCRLQRGEGHEVSVHCLFLGGPLVASLEDAGISVFVHRDRPADPIDCGVRAKARFLRRLHRGFTRLRPDVVHCHNAFATIVGAPAARWAGVKRIVSTRHGLNLHPQNPVQEIPFWLAVRCATRVVAVCKTGEENLAGARWSLPGKLITVHNGAHPAHRSSAPLSFPKRRFQAITVARLNPPKDHATLLRAVALAAKDGNDIGLWIVGDGPQAGMLRSLAAELDIADRVVFAGERHDVGDWLARADLFVLSSQSEGVPLSLLEAMAAGLPALVTALGGMGEVVEFSGAGKLVPTGDSKAMAATLAQMAANPQTLAEWGARARQCYREHFTFERMAEQYMELYTGRAAAKPAAREACTTL